MTAPLTARRLLTIVAVPIEAALACVLVGVAGVGLLIAIVDRRRRVARVAMMGATYLGLEIVALLALGGTWLGRPFKPPGWCEEADRRVLTWLLTQLLGSARRWLGFTVRLDPPVLDPFDSEGPLLVLARHGGLGDSFALVWLLLCHVQRRPKIVLKRMLMWEPLLDVALHRAGACFLPGRSGDRTGAVAQLAAGLGPGDALLLFPEGGNWTPLRRAGAIARLRADHKERAARAAGLMSHVLPPRPAGVLACLEARPDLAVVIVAHTGLDKLTEPGAIWAAIPFQTPMRLRWWPPVAPPAGKEERVQWLMAEWAVVDEWVDAHRPASEGS